MTRNPFHVLAGNAADQLGNVTADQLRAAGLSKKQIRHRIAEGTLGWAGKHVARGMFADSSVLADLLALVLDCGDGAIVSGPTALAVHELDGFTVESPFHVTLPRGRLLDRPPNHIHTSTMIPPEDRTRRHGIPTMAVPRALSDAAKHVSPRKLTCAYDSAIRDRKTTEDAVHEHIARIRSRGRYGIPKLVDVIEGTEAARGGHSWLERRFLEICACAGLPRPQTQQVVTDARSRLVRVDFRFPGTRLVVEVLGYRWHRGNRQQLSRDAERINAIVRSGLSPLQFTYDHVTLEPDWVISEVRAGLVASV